MSVETFLDSSAGVFTALGTLLAAIAGLVTAVVKLRDQSPQVVGETAPGQAPPPGPRERRRREWPLVVAIVLLQAFVIATSMAVGDAFARRGAADRLPPPRVEITKPFAGQPVDFRLSSEGSGSFLVSGSSAGVADQLERRVYVLVHPESPWAKGWWVQSQATVDSRTGEWTSHNWFGDRNFTPAPGHRLQLVAVVAGPSGVTHVDDPKDLRPVAQSSMVPITVGATQRE